METVTPFASYELEIPVAAGHHISINILQGDAACVGDGFVSLEDNKHVAVFLASIAIFEPVDDGVLDVVDRLTVHHSGSAAALLAKEGNHGFIVAEATAIVSVRVVATHGEVGHKGNYAGDVIVWNDDHD